MKQRGRKPSGNVPTLNVHNSADKPKPPSDLTPAQQREWNNILMSLPADWFRQENLPLLAQYCRHIVSAKHVAALIDEYEREEERNYDMYDRLLKMQEREGRAMSSLATRMRITQQATIHPSTQKPSQAHKPWERRK